MANNLVGGRLFAGEEIALRIDQTLTQDATGTLVMRELDRDRIDEGDIIAAAGIHQALRDGRPLELEDRTKQFRFRAEHRLSPRQVEVVLAGGLIPFMRGRMLHAA